MKRITGIVFMVLGSVLLIGALALFLYNRREADMAAEAVADALLSVQSVISEKPVEKNAEGEPVNRDIISVREDGNNPAPLMVAEIDGYGYIGILSFPTLMLELPVMSDWDYVRLKIAPCRQFGNPRTNNLVIAAHYYDSHFGRLSALNIDDIVVFTDVEGTAITYLVKNIEILGPHEVSAVKDSPWDLLLYTCTYDISRRFAVGCLRAE
ncbi:MAG: sortase [Lachnospiraceae bacterium]